MVGKTRARERKPEGCPSDLLKSHRNGTRGLDLLPARLEFCARSQRQGI